MTINSLRPINITSYVHKILNYESKSIVKTEICTVLILNRRTELLLADQQLVYYIRAS